MKNKTWLCFPAIQAAALIQTASGENWVDVMLMAALAWVLLRLPRAERIPKWMELLQALWNAALIGQVLSWFSGCWPEFFPWACLGLVFLALWQTTKGEKAVAAAASVLGLFQLALIAGVLLAAVQDIHIQNLMPQYPRFPGWLLTILLLPALGGKEKDSAFWPGAWALLICLITRGVVPAGAASDHVNTFWEMSRSISVFGKIRRMESLTAVGLSLGFFLLLCFLLGGGKRGTRVGAALPAALGLALFGMNLTFSGAVAAAVSVILWILLPMLAEFFLQKDAKKEENRKD